MANLIPEIARMLGVEIGEEFEIKGRKGLTYKFITDELIVCNDNNTETAYISANMTLVSLIRGHAEIIKLPWKPKIDETFYTFGIHATEDKWVVVSCKWWDNVKNLALYRLGWIYRSQKEAEAALPTVATEMGVSYEL